MPRQLRGLRIVALCLFASMLSQPCVLLDADEPAAAEQAVGSWEALYAKALGAKADTIRSGVIR